MRALLALLILLAAPARADRLWPAPDGTEGREVTVYWSLDDDLADPLVEGFQALRPDVAVRAATLLTGEIHDRIVAETDAGSATADLAFSSAMDLMVKLANDGYAQAAVTPATASWPRWANWRDTAYALTFEPGVIVWHRPSFPDGPPTSRGALADWLDAAPRPAGIGTYDVARSGVGYLLLARDAEHFRDIWSLVAAMGRAGVETYPTTREVLERVADGRLRVGYNVLGSYAADFARSHPSLGLALPRDYVVVISRLALVPRAAAEPDLGTALLAWLMSPEGQTVLAEGLRLPAVSLEVAGRASAAEMGEALGSRLLPVPVSPGLLAYLDRSRHDRLIARWREALGAGAGEGG